uniref:GDCCVxC domain-containing (Seleno)protein n=1 Tax=Roseihalotalea indica TaxID=2867963 RepID=A0AA49JFL6_9BACT|nr:GDCCVxC domain-containing (seleno)protein [Tunicatimonas sp. TK19036]
MPTDACQYFYECESCGQVVKPKAGDCCVYCSYGTVACPLYRKAGILIVANKFFHKSLFHFALQKFIVIL